MSSTNNIKDALIRNNTMIANKLKTDFAKKDEVSELATDKVDKETDNHYGSGQPSSTATISNTNGTLEITSNGTNPNTIKLEKRHGSGSLDSQGDYRNTIAIGNGDQLILESKSNINGSEFQTNSISIAPDGILVERDLFDGDDHDTTIYNLMAELNKVEVLDELTDNWIEYGIDNFNFNKVFSGDDNVIPSQTITFGTANVSSANYYEKLIDLSNLVKGTDYEDNDTNKTKFKNKSFKIAIKKGGVITCTSKIKGHVDINNTQNNYNDSGQNTRTWTANYDQYVVFYFTSVSEFTAMTVTNFVNIYVTENKIKANYYNKSETDALLLAKLDITKHFDDDDNPEEYNIKQPQSYGAGIQLIASRDDNHHPDYSDLIVKPTQIIMAASSANHGDDDVDYTGSIEITDNYVDLEATDGTNTTTLSVTPDSVTINNIRIATINDITNQVSTYQLALGANNVQPFFATITAEAGLEGEYTHVDDAWYNFIMKYAKYVPWHYVSDSSETNHKTYIMKMKNLGQTLIFYDMSGAEFNSGLPTQWGHLTVTKTN